MLFHNNDYAYYAYVHANLLTTVIRRGFELYECLLVYFIVCCFTVMAYNYNIR